MPEMFKKVFFYEGKVRNTPGLITDVVPLHNHPIDNSPPHPSEGTLSTFRIRPKIASNLSEYEFLPYVTNKTIVTPGGVISFLYQVVNNDDAECQIINKNGVFKDVIAIKRVIISSKNNVIKGKIVMTLKK